MRPFAVSVVVVLIVSVAAVVNISLRCTQITALVGFARVPFWVPTRSPTSMVVVLRLIITIAPGYTTTAHAVVHVARFVAARRGMPGVVIVAASSTRVVRRAGSVTIAFVLVTRAALLVPIVNVARLIVQRLIDSTVSGVSPVDVVAPAAVPVSHVPTFSTTVDVIAPAAVPVSNVPAFSTTVGVIAPVAVPMSHVPAFWTAIVAIILVTEANSPGVTVAPVVVIS